MQDDFCIEQGSSFLSPTGIYIGYIIGSIPFDFSIQFVKNIV